MSAYPTASLIKRLAALVYDALVIAAIAMAYGGIFISVKYQLLQVELAPGQRAEMGGAGLTGLLLIIEAFYWFFWCRGGQTLGMKAWRIRVVNNINNGSVSLLQAWVRGLIAPISLLLAGAGYWWSLLQKDGRSWHDLASNTRVIQLPKS